MRAENLIRRMVHVRIVVFGSLGAQAGAAEHFEKAQLQLLRLHHEHIVKGLAEGRVILLRQAGDQIQMLVDVAAGFDFHHGTGQLGEILAALDQLVRLVIGRLHADFEAEDSRRRILGQKIQHLRPHNIRCNLELEYTALMVVDQELEHFHRIAAVDVEGAVQELDDLGPVVDQIEQIRLHPLNIVIAYADLNTR
ncbi:hypothetical protein D3C80_1477000 [compost metagenome]